MEKIFIILILIGIIFYFYIMPCIDLQNEKELKEQYETFNNDIIKIDNSIDKFDTKSCSKQCCKHIQWPIPFNTTDPNNKDLYKDYIGSNFSCNLGPTGSGCLCLKKEDYEYLSNHMQ